MKKSLFIMALGAFALTSCSQDEVLDVQKDAVQFSVVADKASRGAVTTTDNITNFMVNAFKADVTTGGVVTGNLDQFFMKDVEVTGSNTAGWSYGVTKFWPTTDKINFYSYSPASLTGVSIASDVQTITHTVSTTCADQIDVLYALNNGLGKADGEVKVNFRHALAQIVFKARNSKSDLKVIVQGVRVVNLLTSGTLSWPTKDTYENYNHSELPANGGTGDGLTDAATQVDESWGTWDLSGSDFACYPAAMAGASDATPTITEITLVSDAAELSNMTNPLLVMPQTLKPATVENGDMVATAGQQYFAIMCKIYSIDPTTSTETLVWPSTEGYAEVVIPVASPDKDKDGKDAWKQGRKYVYTFVFGEGAGYVGPDGDTPVTKDPIAKEDPIINPDADVNEPGEPVLVPVTFTVSVDQFQTVQEDTDMNTGNTVNP